MHVILPIIFLLKEQLCFFDNVGTDNVLFKNIIFMLDEMLPSFGGNKKQSKIFFCFFFFNSCYLIFFTNKYPVQFQQWGKKQKATKKNFLSFLFQTNFEMFSQDTISSINLLFLKRERYMSPQIASYQWTFKFNGSLCLLLLI